MTTAEYTRELVSTGKIDYATPMRVSYPVGYTSTPDDPEFNNSEEYIVAGDGSYVSYARSWWLSGHDGANSASPEFAAVWPALAPDGGTVAYHSRATATQIKIAVIDTGYYFDQPDTGSSIVAGKDEFESFNDGFFKTDYDVTPTPGGPDADHGTMVASEIAQEPNNGLGNCGAGYDTQVRIYKVQGLWIDGAPDQGYTPGQIVIFNPAITNAIYDATDDGCKVINISLASPYPDPDEQSAIDYAWAHGVVVVGGVGNDGKNTKCYPASADHVVGVGSYSLGHAGTGDPTRSTFSNWGPTLDVLAPGEDIRGPSEPNPGKCYSLWWSGTSMAAPLVSAEAGIIMRLMPSLSASEVISVIQSSAIPMPGQAGYSMDYGYGRISVLGAWELLKKQYPNLDRPAVSGIVSGSYYRTASFKLSWPAIPGYQVSYMVSGDGGAATINSTRSISLSNLVDGKHSVVITARSPRNWAVDSATVITFTVDTKAPAAPAISFDATRRRISWTMPSDGVRAEFSLDQQGGDIPNDGTSAPLPSDLSMGSHSAYVRITDAAGNVGTWGKLSFRLESTGTQISSLKLSPVVTATVSWGSSVALSGSLVGTDTLPIAGARIAVQGMVSGGTWTTLASAVTSTDGSWVTAMVPTRNQTIRASWFGDADYAQVFSDRTVNISTRVWISMPSTPGTVVHRRTFRTSVYLKPRFVAGTHPLVLLFYRWEKNHSGVYVWVLKKTISAVAANYSSYTKCSVSTSVPTSGRWMVLGSYGGSSSYARTTGAARYFTAR
jgi:hypothetical protein